MGTGQKIKISQWTFFLVMLLSIIGLTACGDNNYSPGAVSSPEEPLIMTYDGVKPGTDDITEYAVDSLIRTSRNSIKMSAVAEQSEAVSRLTSENSETLNSETALLEQPASYEGTFPCGNFTISEDWTFVFNFDDTTNCPDLSGKMTSRIDGVYSVYEYENFRVEDCVINGEIRSQIVLGMPVIRSIYFFEDLDVCGEPVTGNMFTDYNFMTGEINYLYHDNRNFYASGSYTISVESNIEQNEDGTISGYVTVSVEDGPTFQFEASSIQLNEECLIPSAGTLNLVHVKDGDEDEEVSVKFDSTSCDYQQAVISYNDHESIIDLTKIE